ncbi:MAG TPA: ATP-binding cassette domain-containing protein, partial [Planctomycetia bacterium]|nr:ATP-binding cassette domain-containing protein [Planctomycetia bacterium]
MSKEVRLEFNDVWKSFRRGENHRSLRDALPALARKLLGRAPIPEKRSDEFFSLKGVNFSVRGGECVGVVGNNGAGKSTLLKCASRILRPNRGAVSVKGRVSALIEV